MNNSISIFQNFKMQYLKSDIIEFFYNWYIFEILLREIDILKNVVSCNCKI